MTKLSQLFRQAVAHADDIEREHIDALVAEVLDAGETFVDNYGWPQQIQAQWKFKDALTNLRQACEQKETKK